MRTTRLCNRQFLNQVGVVANSRPALSTPSLGEEETFICRVVLTVMFHETSITHVGKQLHLLPLSKNSFKGEALSSQLYVIMFKFRC